MDTREQSPLEFTSYVSDGYVSLCKDKLNAGDYSIAGHDMPGDDDSIIIERKKNCLELATNIGAKYDTFKKELEQLAKYKHKAIIVCGNNNFDWLHENKMIQLHPNFIYRQLAEIFIEYGVPVYFIGDRDKCENFIIRLFTRVVSKHE